MRLSWKSIVLLCTLVSMATVADVFNLAVPEDAYPPYIITNEQHEVIGGLLIDPLKEALDALAVELKIHTVPIMRSRLMLEDDQMDGVMHSPDWVEDSTQLLWLDLGVWVVDRLYFKSDAANPPEKLQQLERTELITHIGYIYPNLESLIQQGKVARLDQYSGEEMIRALVGAPQGSERFMVMDSNVWQWHQSRVSGSNQLQESSLLVGCAPLQIRLANNNKMQRLQPLIQKNIKPQRGFIATSQCKDLQKLTLGNK